MWRATLMFACLTGGLSGCGASASRAEVAAAESQAQTARAEAVSEHARLLELEARLLELERRLARNTVCESPPEPRAAEVAIAPARPRTAPLRSEGDFLAEAYPAAPAAPPRANDSAVAASPPAATPASERERLEQLLEALREYGYDPGSGLSPERREALRVLLRRERQLDLMNPWGER